METFLIIVAFFIAFPLLWCFVMMLISGLTGWGSLASHYAVLDMPKDNCRTMQSMQMRRFWFFPGNFNKVITLAVDQHALYIAPMVLFRPFHTPLRLPFEDITLDRSPKGMRIPFWKMSDLITKREPSIKISLRDKDVDWIEEIYGRLEDNES